MTTHDTRIVIGKDLKVGDIVKVGEASKPSTVTEILPYEGSMKDQFKGRAQTIMFAGRNDGVTVGDSMVFKLVGYNENPY